MRVVPLRAAHVPIVVPMWQAGFLELAKSLHENTIRSTSFLGAAAVAAAVSLFFSQRAAAAVIVASAGLIWSPVGGWLLRQALWQGILRQTRQDMVEPRIFEKWCQPGVSAFLVAEDAAGRPVGCVAMLRRHTLYKEARVPLGDASASSEVSVWRLVVDSSARNGGIGRTLMAAAEAWAREHGCTHVSLITGNAASKQFYRRLGYATETRERALRAIFGAPGGPAAFDALGHLRQMMLRSRLGNGSIMAKQLP